MIPSASSHPDVDPGDSRPSLARRDFLKLLSAAATATAVAPFGAMAGPFTREDFGRLVPADKKLRAEWVASLFARGTRTTYRGTDLDKIGMPIGGIGAGQVYLGGDGKLWHWDIFNRHQDSGSSGPHYARPMTPQSPFAQGFAIRVAGAGPEQVRPLDRTGWREIAFTGEYPIGEVDYSDSEAPVQVHLEAFSPFVPLDENDSSLPATIMRFTVKNLSRSGLTVDIVGWLENAVCLHSAPTAGGSRRNRILRLPRYSLLECAGEPPSYPARSEPRPDVLFAGFDAAQYEDWTPSGEAFGIGPVTQAQVPAYQGELGIDGARAVNSHASAPGRTVEEKDSAKGTLTSRPFVIERDFISLLVGGGNHRGRTCVNLLVAGEVAASVTGQAENRMRQRVIDVRPWLGREARLQVVDQESGSWGNIGVDCIRFTDQPPQEVARYEELPDFGTMALALLHADGGSKDGDDDFGSAELDPVDPMRSLFQSRERLGPPNAAKPATEQLRGGLGRTLRLKAGQSQTVTFVLTWYFPNLRLPGLPEHGGRKYGKRFASAVQAADQVARAFESLREQTRLWRATWYDSTLPYWFLDRTFLNTSILASSTSYWLGNDRFYGWEGVGCCAGTCGHVWQYAQAVGRLFPAFERRLREQVDLGVAFDEKTGRIRFRAEHNDIWAVDSQAGVVLRVYREHQVSGPHSLFLRRVWPRTRKALEFLIAQDQGQDGLIDGPQHNTLDTDWWGQVAWLSSLYLAALAAGAEMAKEMGDTAFETDCRTVLTRGQSSLLRLFNGEYFINQVDPAHLDAINSGTGCHIDQVMGQSWAFQVGLPRVLPEKETRSALQALWRYNFTPDVGPYREVYKPGRWYAMPGEAGLLMCTFPASGWDYAQAKGKGPDWAAGYFNECMNGFEYQVAGHMIWEGMLQEGLAITRAVHDRYHPSRRNPWNEIECGDHYARSMASYGVFLALCGYAYHGPRGYLAFAPRFKPELFRAAFTTAEGWGSFSQAATPSENRVTLELRYGRLRLKTLALGALPGPRRNKPAVRVAGRRLPANLVTREGTAVFTFEPELNLLADQTLEIRY